MHNHLVGLLTQIEADVIDESKPVSGILRSCVLLARRAKAPRLREWALKELEGYSPDDPFPPYRTFISPMYIDGHNPFARFTKQVLSPASAIGMPMKDLLSEPVNLQHSIDAIEAMVKEPADSIMLSPGNIGMLLTYLNRGMPNGGAIDACYWALPKTDVQAVLGQVRTGVMKFVDELLAEVEDTGESPTPEKTDSVLDHAMPWIFQVNLGHGTAMATESYTQGDNVGEKNVIKNNKTKVSKNPGTVVAASSNVTACTQQGLDPTKVKEFADFIRSLTPQLALTEPDQAELESALSEVESAAAEPGNQRSRFERAIDRVKSVFSKTAPGFAKAAAVGATDELVAHAIEAGMHGIGL
jgi:hypothetical protein